MFPVKGRKRDYKEPVSNSYKLTGESVAKMPIPNPSEVPNKDVEDILDRIFWCLHYKNGK